MKKPKIIILDDSPIVCGMVKHILESKFDALIFTFTNTEKITEYLLREADVILIDYYLGNEEDSNNSNGLNFLKKINLMNINAKKIIFSGQKDLDLAVSTIREGAIDYIDKNHDNFLEALESSIENVLDFKQTNDSQEKIHTNFKLDNAQFIMLLGVSAVLILAILFIK